MASGVQLGARRARFSWEDCPGHMSAWTGGLQTLPVVDESHGPKQRAYIGFHPFASHVIVADSFEQAYETYVEAIEDALALHDSDVAELETRILAGEDDQTVLESWDAEYGPSGRIIATYEVTLYEVPVRAITWLA